jgi:hypothetical protein
MPSAEPAVIRISRPEWLWGNRRSFVVRIDGRRVGKIRPGMGEEFPVEPGRHSVVVSMDWVRSLPNEVDVQPGTRTELAIRSRPEKKSWWRMVLPIVIVMFLAESVTGLVVKNSGMADPGWLGQFGMFFGIYIALLAIYIHGVPLISPDYWAFWKLEPANR